MKKIECHISDDKNEQIDNICEIEGYTRAEFNRRALELYLMARSAEWEIIPKELIKNNK